MDNAQEFIPIKKVTKIYGVSSQVLRKWEDAGVLESMRTPGNTRIYNRKTLESALGITRTSSQKRNFCYCRVSSQKQSNDLKRQSQYLRDLYPQYTLIEDIGSGINFTRKGLHTILGSALEGNIGEVVVAYKDILARFGFELIETIIKRAGGHVTVLNNQMYQSKEEELAQDLLAIIHVFNCRQMGKRRYNSSAQSQSEDIPNPNTETHS